MCDSQQQVIGKKSRAAVHQDGDWHQTFHFWGYHYNARGELELLLQQRSQKKQDFPNLFDMTASGHIQFNETIEEGLREVKEELGLSLMWSDLEPLMVYPISYKLEDWIDNEFSHVYLYLLSPKEMEATVLQEEEVEGLYWCSLPELTKVVNQSNYATEVKGYRQEKGNKIPTKKILRRSRMCIDAPSYYHSLIEKLNQKQARERGVKHEH
ncbi:MAG TPA: NUDIX hydrolase [Vagococcus sp.]|nr:NUDIX hydrolase [Vagococcus sp.]